MSTDGWTPESDVAVSPIESPTDTPASPVAVTTAGRVVVSDEAVDLYRAAEDRHWRAAGPTTGRPDISAVRRGAIRAGLERVGPLMAAQALRSLARDLEHPLCATCADVVDRRADELERGAR